MKRDENLQQLKEKEISNMEAKDFRNELGLISKSLLIIRDCEIKKLGWCDRKNYIKNKRLRKRTSLNY